MRIFGPGYLRLLNWNPPSTYVSYGPARKIDLKILWAKRKLKELVPLSGPSNISFAKVSIDPSTVTVGRDIESDPLHQMIIQKEEVTMVRRRIIHIKKCSRQPQRGRVIHIVSQSEDGENQQEVNGATNQSSSREVGNHTLSPVHL